MPTLQTIMTFLLLYTERERERERERVLVICHIVSMGSVIHNMCILCMCICVLYYIVKGERKREKGKMERKREDKELDYHL